MILSYLIIVILVVYITTTYVAANEAKGITTDNDGNVYITGYTNVNLDDQLYAGRSDIFVMKYNNNGTKLWTRLSGSTEDDVGRGIAVDSGGNVYVTGYSYGKTLDNQTSLSIAQWGCDIVVMKYSSDGTKLWTRLTASNNEYNVNEGAAVAVDIDDNVYITGYCFGSLDGESYTGGGRDIFVLKYSYDGTKLWTRMLGTTNFESGSGITVDNYGGIYITGSTNGDLDGLPNISDHPAGVGLPDIFVTKFSSDGTKEWTKLSGGGSDDVGTAISVSTDGSVYVTGYAYSNFDGQVKTDNAHPSDIVVIKYSSDGNKNWTKFLGTSGYDVGNGIAVDSSGNAYVVGRMNDELFIGKLSSNGTILWTSITPGDKDGNGIAFDNTGSFYVTGFSTYYYYDDSQDDFYPPWFFGNQPRRKEMKQILVEKYSADGTLLWSRLSPNATVLTSTSKPSSQPTSQPSLSLSNNSSELVVTCSSDGGYDCNCNKCTSSPCTVTFTNDVTYVGNSIFLFIIFLLTSLILLNNSSAILLI